MTFWEVLKDYQSIVAALLGSLVGTIGTLITTAYLNSIGKLEFENNDLEIEYFTKGPTGNSKKSREDDDIYSFYIRTSFMIHNTSNNIKAIHNIFIEFHTKHGKKTSIVKDIDSFRKVGPMGFYDDFKLINFPPKELTLINMRCNSNISEIDFDSRTDKMFLHYQVAGKKYFSKKKNKN